MSEQTHKILVVDDEPHILSAVEDLLEDDHEVITYKDAGEALSDLESTRDVAVILTDQRMPQLAGDEFLQRARKLTDATKILFTGYANLDAVIRAVNEGKIYAYLAKPWDPEQLKTLISNAVSHYDLMQTLKKERALLHALMNNVPDSIYFKNQELQFISVNHVCAKSLGIRDPQSVVGETVDTFLRNGRSKEIGREEQEVLATGNPIIERIEKLNKPDGSTFWGSTTKVPIREENGSITGLISITRDVTVQKLAEERFRRLVECAPDAIVIVDEAGQIELVNTQTEKLFGYERQELLNKPVELLVPDRFRDQHEQHRRNYTTEPKVRPMAVGMQLYGLRKDGTEFPIEISLSPVETEEGVLIASSIRDISERKTAEEELARTNENLQRFNRLAVGREQRMIELKKHVNELAKRLGEPQPYALDFLDNSEDAE